MRKRVLVVEDSILMQRVIGDIIQKSNDFEVCAYARDVTEGWAKFNKFNPDVVTLDFELPGENGLFLLKKLMDYRPTPVLMLSAHTKDGAELTIKSLEMGAVDFFTKPSGPISLDIYEFKDELIEKLKAVAAAKLSKAAVAPSIRSYSSVSEYYIGIAASTGGVRALNHLVPMLVRDSGLKVIIVQHMPRYFTASLAKHLNERSSLSVREAKDGDLIMPGVILIAPGGFHIRVAPSGEKVLLTDEPPRHGVKPSADVLFESMAQVFSHKAVGLILTGMGHDGTAGLMKIRESGGLTIAQDPDEATIDSMPQSAIDAGVVDFVLTLDLMADKIMGRRKND